MFQTEPIIYLQSHGTQCITNHMIQITQMGSSSFLVPIIIIAIFGVDFKKGFLLFQLFLWTTLFTETLKILVGFPRPYFLDNRVMNLEDGIKNISPFTGNRIKSIFSLPDKQILTQFRLHEAFKPDSFGCPSGHMSRATALWGGIATVFNTRILKILTPFVIVLMAFSRLYLGKHFIGDVLGGTIVGLVSLVVFVYFLKSPLKNNFFKKKNFELAFRSQNLFFYGFMFVIPIVFLALSLIKSDTVGYFFGVNVAYLLIIRKGIPDDIGNIEQRTTRTFIALLLFEVSKIIIGCWFGTAGMTNYLQFTNQEIGFLKTFIPVSTIWVSVVICKQLNLYLINEGSL